MLPRTVKGALKVNTNLILLLILLIIIKQRSQTRSRDVPHFNVILNVHSMNIKMKNMLPVSELLYVGTFTNILGASCQKKTSVCVQFGPV